MSWRSLAWRALLALGLGAGSVFGFAPFSFYLLPVLTLAGWFWLVRDLAPRESACLGGLFGWGYFGVGIGWLYISLSHYGGMPVGLALLAVGVFAGYLALFPALAGWVAARVSSRPLVRLWVLPAALALTDWLRGWVFSGFPWLSAGYSQAPDGWLAGYFPLLGVYGVTLLTALLAAGLASLWLPALRQPQRISVIAMMLLTAAGGVMLGRVNWTHPTGGEVSVALLQGNVPQDRKWQESSLIDTLDRYRRLVLSARQQLIVLPETALPLFLSDIPAGYLEQLRAHALSVGGDVLLGVPALAAGGQQYHNTVTSMGVSGGQSYRKIHLVPFGEFIPFKSLLGTVYQSLNIPLTDFAAGSLQQPLLEVAGQQVLVNICYEDVFGEELAGRARTATLLLNVTNDAWYDRSPAAMQHLQIAQARSLELGRYMLRATNTGMTAIIDHRGHLQRLAPWFTEMALTGTAKGFTGITPYMRWGNGPAVMVMVLMLAIGWRISRSAA